MRTIAVTSYPKELQHILRIAKRQDIILCAERDQILVSLIDDFDFEIASQRRNKKLMAFLKESFRQARKEKGIPLEEVRRRLGLPPRSGNHQGNANEAEKDATKKLAVSRRSQAILGLLAQACSEGKVLQTITCRV